MHDAIVVGSGPGATFAALGLSGRNVLVLDVGRRPPAVPDLQENLFELRRDTPDLFELLIGCRYEGLHNLHERNISLKLKAPLMRYVTEGWEDLCPVAPSEFETTLSFAQGGLANAWGAGVYRFDDAELADYPIGLTDLEPYYDEVTEHIGITGAADDLAPYFGSTRSLLPPLRRSKLADAVVQRYAARRGELHEAGVFIGQPRLAVLSEPHRGRPPFGYRALEFFRPWDASVYNPAFTLDELVAAGRVEYRSGRLVVQFTQEQGQVVAVTARNLETGEREVYRGRRLLLGAGAIGSAKLALQANGDHATALPIQDNAMSVIPLVHPGSVGAPLDVHDSSFAQLNLVYQPPGCEPLQASLYGATGPLRTDVLFRFPLAIRDSLRLARFLAPAIATLMLFRPGTTDVRNRIRLQENGELDIQCVKPTRDRVELELIRAMRKLGLYGASALCQYPDMGAGLHYAATLPMRRDPGPYETDRDGRLFGTRGVFVVDGGCLTQLPSKNLTLTIMANALRIGRGVARELT